MNFDSFLKLPLMGIVRGVSIDKIEPLMEAVISAGLKAIEITMNTPGASEIIAKAGVLSRGRIYVGAGTVLTREELDLAVRSGAGFIVLPANIQEVVELCVQKNIPVFPGAFSPQEVLDAWGAGARMVKVFPSGMFGPKYIKELKGPFNKVRLMAVGGVRPENIEEYFCSGADAVAFGGSVFKKEWLDADNFDAIRDRVAEYVNSVRSAIV